MRVAEILKTKGGKVLMITPDTTMAEFAKRITSESVGALLVSTDNASVDGIISERDLARGIAASGPSVLAKPVSHYMTRAVVVCEPTDKVSEVAATMTRQRFRHIPVIDAGRIVGFISIGDVLKARLEEMDLESKVLREYATVIAISRPGADQRLDR
jgi:CBS domain-containing protein